MDCLKEKVRLEAPWNMIFADDVMLCTEAKEEVDELLESWGRALEGRGLRVSRQKTEYLCAGGGAVVTGNVQASTNKRKWVQIPGLCSASKRRVRHGGGKEDPSWME